MYVYYIVYIYKGVYTGGVVGGVHPPPVQISGGGTTPPVPYPPVILN